MALNIAIDGPSGAGKSTTARALAEKLGFLYIDTGALYRSIGFYCIKANVSDLSSAEQVSARLKDIHIELKFINGQQRVYLNGSDVSDFIRTPEVSMAASAVSAIPEVRAFLLDLQRNIAKKNNIIMDGRDIGTVILPNAQVKFFLSASLQSRARRRMAELAERGIDAKFETVFSEMKERDENDSSRAIAPLKAADDAIMVDNSDLSLEETVCAMKRIIEERTKECFTDS